MKKFLVALVTITLGILPMAAHAVVNLDSATANDQKFAKELVVIVPPATTANLTNFVPTIDAQSALGFSIGLGTSKYVRFNLTGDNAKFAGLGVTSPSIVAKASTITLSQGGNGFGFVIYEVQASATDITPTDRINLSAPTYTVEGTSSSVTMSYAIYGTASEAVNQTGALSTQLATFLTFPSGVKVTESHTTTPEQINVLDGSKTFVAAAPLTTVRNVMGEVSVLIDTLVLDPADGQPLAAVDIAQFVNTTAALNLTGDFTATLLLPTTLTGVYLDTTAPVDCASKDVVANAVAAGTATIPIGQAEIPAGSFICFEATGGIPIVATTFDGTYNTGGGKLANVSLPALDTFIKNSKALQSPWFSTQAGYTTRFIMSNMGNAAVQFSIKAYTTSGGTVTYKAPYNGLVSLNPGVTIINAKDMVTVAGSVNASILFEFQGSTTTLQGEYQFLNLSTGIMDSVVMGPPNP